MLQRHSFATSLPQTLCSYGSKVTKLWRCSKKYRVIYFSKYWQYRHYFEEKILFLCIERKNQTFLALTYSKVKLYKSKQMQVETFFTIFFFVYHEYLCIFTATQFISSMLQWQKCRNSDCRKCFFISTFWNIWCSLIHLFCL